MLTIDETSPSNHQRQHTVKSQSVAFRDDKWRWDRRHAQPPSGVMHMKDNEISSHSRPGDFEQQTQRTLCDM